MLVYLRDGPYDNVSAGVIVFRRESLLQQVSEEVNGFRPVEQEGKVRPKHVYLFTHLVPLLNLAYR